MKEEVKKNNILVVEESELVMRVLYTMLDYYFNVDWALDGTSGLKLLEKNKDKYDIILTNHTMPGMSGVKFIKQVRQMLPSIPIVCFVDDFMDGPEVMEAGANAFVVKPFRVLHLLKMLRRKLGYRDTEEELIDAIAKGNPAI
ncbi:MAG: hypothetical protein DRG27_01675 [Deltaproteobacteria bacterium]|nr:MAG: hypothetical protein DRG27_01675 [Deltaproteobacteria bacterium]